MDWLGGLFQTSSLPPPTPHTQIVTEERRKKGFFFSGPQIYLCLCVLSPERQPFECPWDATLQIEKHFLSVYLQFTWDCANISIRTYSKNRKPCSSWSIWIGLRKEIKWGADIESPYGRRCTWGLAAAPSASALFSLCSKAAVPLTGPLDRDSLGRTCGVLLTVPFTSFSIH